MQTDFIPSKTQFSVWSVKWTQNDPTHELLNDYVQKVLPSKISSSSFMSSSSEQMLSTFTSISVTGEYIKRRRKGHITERQPTETRLGHLTYTTGITTFLSDKWQRPGEDIHEVGQPVGMWWAVELSDVHDVVFVFEHSSCCWGSRADGTAESAEPFRLVTIMVTHLPNICQ